MTTEQSAAARNAKKDRKVRNFKEEFYASYYRSPEGWFGIPTAAIRNALIRACKPTRIAMTDAKLYLLLVHPDGFDYQDESVPLLRIEGKPRRLVSMVRNAGPGSMPDIRVRAMFKEWTATLRIRFDRSSISQRDVANLVYRAGMQVGIGQGRPSSTNSNGMGWGTFMPKQ